MEFPDYRERERLQEQAREKRRQESERLNKDLSWLLSDARGRNVLRHLLRECRLTDTNFTGNSETFKLEGRREVALSLIRWMREAEPSQTRNIVGDLFVGNSDD